MGRLAILTIALAACMDEPRLGVDKPALDLPRGAAEDVAVELDGAPLAAAELMWLVDDPSVASVALTPDGAKLRIQSGIEGATTVHLGLHGQVLDLPTRVSPPAFVQLWIEPASVSAPLGSAVPIRATAIDTTGTIRDVSSMTGWQVMDPEIATLDQGMVHGDTPGHTMLQAVLAGTQSSAPITVY